MSSRGQQARNRLDSSPDLDLASSEDEEAVARPGGWPSLRAASLDWSDDASSPSQGTLATPSTSSSQTLVGILTPSRSRGNTIRFLLKDGSDLDSDEEMENIDPRAGPTTPRLKHGKRARYSKEKTPSPSKFIVKGTVTPSRAAPLFSRSSRKRNFSSTGSREEQCSPGRPARYRDATLDDLESDFDLEDYDDLHERANDFTAGEVAKSAFLPSRFSTGRPAASAYTSAACSRHAISPNNAASYILALRSNTVAPLPHARSGFGNEYGSCSTSGVLGVSRALGAGCGRTTKLSQRPYHMTFQSHEILDFDTFYVPSAVNDGVVAHPMCADYSYSSRRQGNSSAQWLAVGDNDGHLHLLNTLIDPMASEHRHSHFEADADRPASSIFEVKWRCDDEMIASGSSDYAVRIYSSETGKELRALVGHRGSPRSIAWDPNGGGNILVSGARDGAIHLYDLRVRETSYNGIPWSPCLSLWEAHLEEEPVKRGKGFGGRPISRLRGSLKQPRGVTSVIYLPDRGPHLLASAGCVNAKIKLWDLRYSADQGRKDISGAKRKPAVGEEIAFVDPLDQGMDVSKQSGRNKSSHGISNIVAGGDKVFAACTDGCIYTINASDFLQTSYNAVGYDNPPLFSEYQRGNTLYNRMALLDDDRTLALGCNSGVVTLWDTHCASQAVAEKREAWNEFNRGDDILPPTERQFSNSTPAALFTSHSDNFEINSVSWAHGSDGPTLATVSDGMTIRTWHATPRNSSDYGLIRD